MEPQKAKREQKSGNVWTCGPIYKTTNWSTQTALTRVHNDITMAMDNKKVVILVLLDLSAAFDTVNHSILLAWLQKRFGVKGEALDWFRTYLMNRTQTVSLPGGAKSGAQNLTFGVPQGSVLGGVLFCVYTSPIGDILHAQDMSYHLYADDLSLYLALEPNYDHCQIYAIIYPIFRYLAIFSLISILHIGRRLFSRWKECKAYVRLFLGCTYYQGALIFGCIQYGNMSQYCTIRKIEPVMSIFLQW